MLLEIFVNVANLESLFSGKPTNCKINYADQYDVRLLIDPRKYTFVRSKTGINNIITLRKKNLIERLRFKNKSN